MIALLLTNPLCWLMLLLSLLCYQLLLQDALILRRGLTEDCGQWHHVITVLIASLPLCGLLGTIIGLLDVFANLGQSGDAGGISEGIGQALFTTQLGLTLAIPAWLLQSHIHSKLQHSRLPLPEDVCSNA